MTAEYWIDSTPQKFNKKRKNKAKQKTKQKTLQSKTKNNQIQKISLYNKNQCKRLLTSNVNHIKQLYNYLHIYNK